MGNRMGRAALCAVVVVTAVFGVYASSALALPEVGRCVAEVGGQYRDGNCTERGSPGSFEFVKNAIKKGFAETSLPGKIQLEGASGTAMTCTGQTATGEYRETGTTPATKEVHHVVVRLFGCEIPLFSAKCQNTSTEGEIVSTQWKGPFDYITGKGTSSVVVGLALSPEVKKKGWMTFKCPTIGEEQYWGEGLEKGHETAIADLSKASVNVVSPTYELLYRGSKGIDEPDHKEGSSVTDNFEVSLEGPKGTFEKGDWELTTQIENEEELEIKA